jgi:hypothetical protein
MNGKKFAPAIPGPAGAGGILSAVALAFALVLPHSPLAGAEESRSSPQDPPAPEIHKPLELEEIITQDEGITLSWSRVPRASSYHCILARDRLFKIIVYDRAVGDDTSLTLTSLDFGTYFFKVSSISPGGQEGPFTETVMFIVVPDPRPVSRE